MENIKPISRSQADAAWKDILDQFLEGAIALCFPQVHACINWQRRWDSLDQEFRVIAPDSIKRKQVVNKLIRVYLLEGEEMWLLIHLEIQGSQDNLFANRMFAYHYRIYDKFGRHPLSCAILTDGIKKWRSESYQYNNLGCELLFKYPVLKVLDMAFQRNSLEINPDPFAVVILVQLDVLQSRQKGADERCSMKIKLTKRLYEKGFSGDIIIALYKFIDGMIRLPEQVEIEYKSEIYKFEERKRMYYISTIERMGIEQGMQQGLQKGLQQGVDQRNKEIVLRMLQKGQSIEMISELTGLDKTEVNALTQQFETL